MIKVQVDIGTLKDNLLGIEYVVYFKDRHSINHGVNFPNSSILFSWNLSSALDSQLRLLY